MGKQEGVKKVVASEGDNKEKKKMKCFLFLLSCLTPALLAQERQGTLSISNGIRLFTNRFLQSLKLCVQSLFSPLSVHTASPRLSRENQIRAADCAGGLQVQLYSE